MSKKYILGAITILMAASVFLAPAVATAQTNTNTGTTPITSGGDKVQSGLDDIGGAFPEGVRDKDIDVASLAHRIINWALYLAAIIAVIFIIIGGFMYITSAGDQTKAGKGRQTLVNALIGLTLVVLSYIIVQIVYRFITTA